MSKYEALRRNARTVSLHNAFNRGILTHFVDNI